ncbi:MAG: tRNA (adenosine(37)-N6)-dimethylallyltransferase MiaA, partial [Clostridia bacterium]|nr:tRNA (adenosine(37)-N6)-dimethylallyltransferase MiaA [Clostridia bacterium]
MGKGLIHIKAKIPVLAVCGPTASGKTALAVELAKRFDGEVVSSDSMQIYKGMDIGTAKPTAEEMQGVVHHMLDVAEIDCNFSVSDYCRMAHKIIADIHSRGKLPVIAGGTGLYVDSLLNDIDFNSGESDRSVRLKYENTDAAELHALLQKLDPEAAAEIHMNNVKRVIRALEHIEITGEKFSQYKKKAASGESRYNPLILFIDWDREELYKRINLRVDIMVKEGLLDEARRIYDAGCDRSLTSMCAIGYKELFEYFDGNLTLDEAIDSIKQNSRRYAKRQLTWFRRNERLCRLNANENL